MSLCRKLIEAGVDPDRPLHAYRSDVLTLIVHTLGAGARLTVAEGDRKPPHLRQWKAWRSVEGSPPVDFNASDHAGAFAARADYLVFSDGIRDPMDFTPEASRRARAFTVWAALQSLGHAGVAELVDRCCARARQFAGALREIPGVEVANDVVINQIVVRFPGLDGVREAVSASGACVMTPTMWKGEPGVRISVSNWQTTERDIEISLDAIRAAVVAAPQGTRVS